MQILNYFLPTLWRQIVVHYMKTLSLMLIGCLIILISARLGDLARIFAQGASLGYIVLYLLYQIPYVLQIAFPLSSFIASLYLFQSMSSKNELTAARAQGISLYAIIAPVLLTALLFSLVSFKELFDLSAKAHLATKKLEFRLKEKYPLATLQSSNLLEQSGMFLEMKGSLIQDDNAKDLILGMRNGKDNRCTVFIAKTAQNKDSQVQTYDVSVITSTPSENPDSFDTVIIENIREASSPIKGLSFITNTRIWKPLNDLLPLKLLIAKVHTLQQLQEEKMLFGKSDSILKEKLERCTIEFVRRFSLSLSITTLTLLGIAYGCTIGRIKNRRRLIIAGLATTLFLICFLGGKAIERHSQAAIILFLLPHPILLFLAIKRLFKIQKGIEG